MVAGIGPAAAAFATSVYSDSTLGLREFEAARLRVAKINGCLNCSDWRTERDGEIVELSICPGSWIGFGRLDRVLGLDAACVLPSHLARH
jgi:alkylhydroperoxidase family enzyme